MHAVIEAITCAQWNGTGGLSLVENFVDVLVNNPGSTAATVPHLDSWLPSFAFVHQHDDRQFEVCVQLSGSTEQEAVEGDVAQAVGPLDH